MDDAERLREFLVERHAACPCCGYNLRNLASNRCPECGAALVLQVGAPQGRFGLFLIAVAPMLMLTAFGMFVGIAWLPLLLQQPPGALILFIAAIVDLVGAIAAYRKRGLFFQLSRPRQIGVAVLSWVVNSAVFGVCLALEV